MSMTCCSRSIDRALIATGFVEKSLSTEEAWGQIANEESKLPKRRRRASYRDEYESQIPYHLITPLDERFLVKQKGHAIILGWGNDFDTPNLLIRLGWKVTAVDRSLLVLADLKDHVSENVVLIHEKIEDYQFPENVQLILAHDAFPYCEPEKFRDIWNRAYASLAPGGIIAANLFAHPGNQEVDELQRLSGTWYTNKSATKAILKGSGYEIEQLNYRNPWLRTISSFCDSIDFIGRKPD